ncbi:hypothetical protein ABPG72_013094 [Tetrahymena utriculariae]
MSDSDSDEGRVVEEPLPLHIIRFNDMAQHLLKKVIKQADALIKENPQGLEKDIALNLVKFVKSQPEFKIGDGEWQCIIGKNFGCSLTFDANVLAFFDLLPSRKSILLFKSG